MDPHSRAKGASRRSRTAKPKATTALDLAESEGPATPRTKQLLDIVNSRDLTLIRGLHGFGAKKAQDLVDNLDGPVVSLSQLRLVPGMGGRTLNRAYEGLSICIDA